jgi:hypothetical protein
MLKNRFLATGVSMKIQNKTKRCNHKGPGFCFKNHNKQELKLKRKIPVTV